MTSHSKIAQFNLECIAPLRHRIGMNISRDCYCPGLKRMQLTRAAFLGSLNTREDSWEKPMHPLKNMTLCYFITWSLFLYNKSKVEYMRICNHIEHYSTKLCYVTRTKHDCTSVQYIFSWNTSVTDYKQRRSPLPRSIKNSTVTVCNSVCIGVFWRSCDRASW